MKSIEQFLSELSRRQSPSSAAFTFHQSNPTLALPGAVREAASHGWQVFPRSPLAKLTGNPDLLIGEATTDLPRLEELAAQYPLCDWRVALGPSSLCVLELVGQQGRESFAALSREHGECLTLQSQRGDSAWAFFRYPHGLVLRESANKLTSGLRVLGPAASCIIPPSGGSFYVNPWAEVESVPWWLRELAFETPDVPPADTVRLRAAKLAASPASESLASGTCPVATVVISGGGIR